MIKSNEALNLLKEGNNRFVKQLCEYPNQSIQRVKELKEGQSPFVSILSCSDSRVPVEMIFDRGIGDIFSIRTAGHTLSEEVLGSIEYSVEHLNVPLVIVLGHQLCGAVNTALSSYPEGKVEGASNNLQAIMDKIYLALEDNPGDGCTLDCAVRSNINHQVNELIDNNEIVSQKVKSGELRVIGAYYSFEDGVVDFYE